MATEAIEGAETAAASGKGGGMMKMLGTGFGLFVLMILSGLISPILGCKIMPGAMPGCLAGEPVAENADAEEAKAPPQYLALDPPLVVSFEDRSAIRFLQVTVEVMARDEESIQAVQTHTPVIRNNLLMLMGGQTLSDLTKTEGKEKLRQAALAEVQRILTENTGKPGIEDLYFTSFVVQ